MKQVIYTFMIFDVPSIVVSIDFSDCLFCSFSLLFNKLDNMRGLDETGGNVETAQVSGEIHTGSLTGAEIAEFNARYPYVRVTADHTSSLLKYYNGNTCSSTP